MLAILAEDASVPAQALQHRGPVLPELYDDLAAVTANDRPGKGADGDCERP